MRDLRDRHASGDGAIVNAFKQHVWINHDHNLAIVPEFGLPVSLNPAGSDLARFTRIEDAA